ncbi:recombinase family protein [Runella aurantiaca]|uniref:Resolvase n=1 Tax=Runella aurantiaca TaxID=2282308 RepID=A0A369I6K8_9BACT|nr:recombinase family protein [Runella aurantiaca]RDB02306.1 resolvase [Runella aurantiaca]
MKPAIAYYRVSTDRQGKSGLGLEAQAEAVQNYVSANGYQLAGSFTEIESGRKNNRPQLLDALSECKRIKAILIIAKLDRLGRNVAFIANLMESRVQFVAVDNPHATDLVLHITAAFAQFEREQISKRVKEALQAAKRRGTILGKNGREVLSQQNKQAADEFAAQIAPTIEQLKAEGFTTERAICAELNARQIPTPREGAQWHRSSVHRLLKRLD